MGLVRGKNVVVLFFHSGVWLPYACARSCSLSVNTDFIETSVSGAGKWRTFSPQANSFTGSIEGLLNLEKINTLSLADLRAKQYAQTRLLVRFERTDDDTPAHVYSDQFYCYISNSTDTSAFDNVATFNVDLQGDGPITQVFTPSPIITGTVLRLEYTAAGGETSITDTDLINKTIVEVVNDGMGFSPIITSGTPIAKEAKYISGTGTIEFPAPLEEGQEVYIIYQ